MLTENSKASSQERRQLSGVPLWEIGSHVHKEEPGWKVIERLVGDDILALGRARPLCQVLVAGHHMLRIPSRPNSDCALQLVAD